MNNCSDAEYTEDDQDDHAGVLTASGAWSVEGRNVGNPVSCNNLKGSCKDEGGTEKEAEEWVEHEEEQKEKKERGQTYKNQLIRPNFTQRPI